MKKGSAIYDYLDATGILQNGTPEEIALAKKTYWIKIRKEWKEQQRKEKKGYTIFLSEEAVNSIRKIVGTKNTGVAGYIKQATLASMAAVCMTDKKVVGEVRECIYTFYNKMSEHVQIIHMPATNMQLILDEIELLQKRILTILQKKHDV